MIYGLPLTDFQRMSMEMWYLQRSILKPFEEFLEKIKKNRQTP